MIGIDYLGGNKYKSLVLSEHPTGMAAGFFYYTFGKSIDLIAELLKTGKCPRVRVHAIYEADHKYIPKKHNQYIIKAIRALNALKEQYPSIDIQFSPFCEHRLNGTALVQMFNMVKKEAKGLVLVNSFDKGGGKLPGVINEIHSSLTSLNGEYNFSYDGLACVDSNVEKFKKAHAKANTFFLWEPRFNGRWESDDKTPIDERKGWPDAELIRSVAFLAKDKGLCAVPNKWTYKSHAENKGKKDRRAEMPCLIAPVEEEALYLVSDAGKILAKLKYFAPYGSGMYRYYGDEWGYKIAQKAIAMQGHPILKILNKKDFSVHGTLNPAFREGIWRDVVL